MKILQVMAGAKRGGAETAFVDMCLAMHEAGQQIEVVTRPNDIRVPKMRAAGIMVHTLPFGSAIDFYTPWAITRIIKKFQPAIVQSWMSRAPAKVSRWNASMAAPRYYHVARLGSYYKMKYFKTVEYFVPITPDIGRYLVENGIDQNHVCHINNFAEVEQAGRIIDRAEFDTPEGAALLLGLGRLHESKAFDVLIRAVADLPDVHCWIAGEGPLRAELEQMIDDLGVGDRVKLLGWQDDRAALFQACDICTFISRIEGFGTVFVQSWAQNTPVIVSAADGPKQFVRDGEDGLVVPIDDVEALKSAISRVLGDESLQKSMIENGHKRYLSEFTKDQSVKNYLNLYNEIAG